jgi:serpin B
LKIEKSEEIHHQFQKLLAEISKPTDDYELNITNRLFGEKTYLFLQVSFAVFTPSINGG